MYATGQVDGAALGPRAGGGSTWPVTLRMVGVLLVVSLPLWRVGSARPDILKQYCEQATFEASCPAGEVVLMDRARYGRMQLGGECLGYEYGQEGCYNDVLKVMDSWCSGRQECSKGVRDLPVILEPQLECPKELRGYLEANYTCVPVSQPHAGCCTSSRFARIRSSGQFIGSIVTKETGCGSIDCPWIIEALPGQTINITLMDFDLAHARQSSYPNESPSSKVCHVYAIIKENAPMQTSQTICGGEHRKVHAYLSQSHAVEVRIVQNNKQKEKQAYFLLAYTFLGCPNPVKPRYGYVERTGNKAVIGCNGDEQSKWELTCIGNQWSGTYGNCSDAGAAGVSGVLEDILSIPPDISILIVVMIALAIAFVILTIGVVYLKRRWSRPDSPHNGTGGYAETQNVAIQNRNLQKSPKPVGSGDHPPAEHSYFQTWEIHRPTIKPPGSQHGMHVPRESYNRTGPGTVDNSSTMGRYVDHVYEDPAFDRKDGMGAGMGMEGHGASQYYELEPDSDGIRRSLPPLQRNGKAFLVKERSPKQRCSFPGTTVDTHALKSGQGSLTS